MAVQRPPLHATTSYAPAWRLQHARIASSAASPAHRPLNPARALDRVLNVAAQANPSRCFTSQAQGAEAPVNLTSAQLGTSGSQVNSTSISTFLSDCTDVQASGQRITLSAST